MGGAGALLNGVKHILALIPPYPLHPAARSGHGQRYRNDYEQSRDYLRVTPTGHEDERGEDAGEDSDTADEL